MRTSHLLASLVALGVSVVCAGAFAQPAQPAQKDQPASGTEKKPSADHATNNKKKKKPAEEKEQQNGKQKQPAKAAGAAGNKTESGGNQQGAAPGTAGATSGGAGASASGSAGASPSGAATSPATKSAAGSTPAATPKSATPSTVPAAPAPPPGAAKPATGSASGSAQLGVAATVGAPAAPQRDQNASAGKSNKKPLINTLGIELEGGPNARLDGKSSGITGSESVGLTYGVGVWYSPTRLWSLGLSYEHTGLGGSSTAPTGTGNTVSADRTLHSVWLAGRAYPWRTDSLGVYLALELGAAWQHVDASGESDTNPDVTAPQPFACSATQGPGIAIGAGGGLDVDLDSHLAFLVQADVAENRLTSDQIGGCAQGSGSVSNLAARIGLMYRFAVGPQSSSATASATPTLARF